MKSTAFLVLLLLFFCKTLDAQIPEGQMVGHWSSEDLDLGFTNLYNEVWGFVHNEEEYAAIGSYKGIHIIQLDHADGPTEVAFVAGADQNVKHREIQSYGHYLYAVAQEGSSSLQVIDFSNLPESVEVVLDTDEWFSVTENIFIDEENARLYTSDSPVSGIQNLILSLENPALPTELGAIQAYGGGHGLNVRDNVAVLNRGNIGLSIIDCTDAQNTDYLGGISGYPDQGYAHSGWITDDGKHYIMLEDLFTELIKVFNIENYSDIKVVDFFKSDSSNPSTAYDVMIKGDLAYIAYYGDGLRVFNISNPENVIAEYRFETVTGAAGSNFSRATGVYCQLPSERILVSDRQNGLFLVTPPEVSYSVLLSEYDGDKCVYGDTLTIGASIGNGFDPSTFNYLIDLVPEIADVEILGTPEPGNTITIQLSNFKSHDSAKLFFSAADANTSSSDQFEFLPITPSDGITLTSPANLSYVSPTLDLFFDWEDLSILEADEYEIEVSLNESFSLILYSLETTNSFASFGTPLGNKEHYWRVTGRNECGNFTSDVFSFTTEEPNSVQSFDENEISLFPNPVHEELVLNTTASFDGTISLKLMDNLGKLVHSKSELTFPINIDTQEFSSGIYYLQLFEKNSALGVKKIFIKH